MKIIIFKKVDDLQKYCAQLFIDEVKKNPKAKLGFATGVSPVDAYSYIVKDHQKNHTSWKDVQTFNLDEFVGLKKDHPQAFIQQMQTNLFQYLDLNPQNIHIPNIEAKDPHQEADEYEKLVEKLGPIDFQYISLGVNGHMAYNEPGTPVNSKTHVVQLTRETILDMVAKKKFASETTAPKAAITMGIQTLLCHTKKAIMVAYGAHKAKVTKQMLEESPNNTVTASYLQLHPDCTFLLDESAASLLSAKTLAHAKRS